MSLAQYFDALLVKVQTTDAVQNDGKDDKGFYEPTRAVLVQRLSLLKDLHAKPAAKPMLRQAWAYVTEHLPPEWLVLSDADKAELKKMLS